MELETLRETLNAFLFQERCRSCGGGPGALQLPRGPQQDDPYSQGEEFCKRIIKYIGAHLTKENKAARQARIKDRTLELKVDWKRDGGRRCYAAVREEPELPTLVLKRQDGSMTANPEEMHQLMGKVWVEGIFNKKISLSRTTIGGPLWKRQRLTATNGMS